MQPSLRTRIAPTPSGYLHLGNLANFLLIEKLAKEAGGKVLLRIDDCDGTRSRPEFVEHIFSTLEWLGVEWHEGPRDARDFEENFSQARRKDYYFQRLQELSGRIYACSCSRKDVSGVYPGHCRERKLEFSPGMHALRLRIEDPGLAAAFGDVVVWRKDGGPAYHWVSVVDDLDGRINLIVRGEDLRESSRLQKHIAALVRPGGFAGVSFLFHPLLEDEAGKKLSKSQGSSSVLELRQKGESAAAVRERLRGVVEAWSSLARE
jgi:glutamyl/glutaminyl-tRNA synthetase